MLFNYYLFWGKNAVACLQVDVGNQCNYFRELNKILVLTAFPNSLLGMLKLAKICNIYKMLSSTGANI